MLEVCVEVAGLVVEEVVEGWTGFSCQKSQACTSGGERSLESKRSRVSRPRAGEAVLAESSSRTGKALV